MPDIEQNSENVELLQAIIDGDGEYTKEVHSRNAAILKSIINNTEYDADPQSEIEELLLELKEVISGGGSEDFILKRVKTNNDSGASLGAVDLESELPNESWYVVAFYATTDTDNIDKSAIIKTNWTSYPTGQTIYVGTIECELTKTTLTVTSNTGAARYCTIFAVPDSKI